MTLTHSGDSIARSPQDLVGVKAPQPKTFGGIIARIFHSRTYFCCRAPRGVGWRQARSLLEFFFGPVSVLS